MDRIRVLFREGDRGVKIFLVCRRACILVTKNLFSGILNFQKIKDTMLAPLLIESSTRGYLSPFEYAERGMQGAYEDCF